MGNWLLHRISCTWLAQHQVRNSPRLLITLDVHMKLNKYVKNYSPAARQEKPPFL